MSRTRVSSWCRGLFVVTMAALIPLGVPTPAVAGPPTVTIHFLHQDVTRDESTIVFGSVRRLPSPPQEVDVPIRLQRKVGNAWHTVATDHLKSPPTYALAAKLPVGFSFVRVQYGSPTEATSAELLVRVLDTMSAAADNKVWAWGRNSEAELGTGHETTQGLPAPVPHLSGVTAVATTSTTSLALRSDGTVWAWGSEDFSGRFDGDHQAPRQVPGIDAVTAIAASGSAGIALRADGTVWAWGTIGYGGYYNSAPPGLERFTPGQVSRLSHIVAIAGGVFTGFALASDGDEWVWGFEDSGGTGDGHNSDHEADPFVLLHHVQGLGQTVDSRTGAALLAGGVVKAWGSNVSGQIGSGLAKHELRPVAVPGIRQATQVRFSGRDGYALLSDGTVRAWGSDASAGYGDGDPALLTRPGTVQVALPRKALAIAAGGDGAFALLTNHTVVSWGKNVRLGLGTPLPVEVFPALVPLPADVIEIAAGSETGLAVTSH